MNIQKIAIIGSSGNVGGLLAQTFAEAFPGAVILKLSRDPKDDSFTKFDPFQDVLASLGKPDVLVNAAGIIRESENAEFEKVHVKMVEKLLAQRKDAGNPYWIQISALGADPLHKTGFLRTKGIADLMVLNDGNAAVLRPSVVCFPNGMLVEKLKQAAGLAKLLLNHLPMPQKMLKTAIQPVLPADLAAVALHVVKKSHHGIVDLVGPEQITLKELVQMVHINKHAPIPVGLPGKVIELIVRDFFAVWFPGIATRDQVLMLMQNNIGDAHAIEEILGHKPGSTLEFWETHLAMNPEL